MDLCKQFPGQPLQRPMLALHRSDSDHHNFYPTLEELQDWGTETIYARENGLQSQFIVLNFI